MTCQKYDIQHEYFQFISTEFQPLRLCLSCRYTTTKVYMLLIFKMLTLLKSRISGLYADHSRAVWN